VLAFSRFVTLRAAEDGTGAVAAFVADGTTGLWISLPWLLTPQGVEDINALRKSISATLSSNPASDGESAANLQLRLMRLSVHQRPPLSASQSAAAVAAASDAQTPIHASPSDSPTELLPPLRMISAPLGANGLSVSEDPARLDPDSNDAEDDAVDWANDEEPLELLCG